MLLYVICNLTKRISITLSIIFTHCFIKKNTLVGTSTGNTANVADMIAQEFGDDAEGPFEIDDLQGNVAKKFAEYNALVVGTPTWNTGADTERSGTGWDEIYYGEMQGKRGNTSDIYFAMDDCFLSRN